MIQNLRRVINHPAQVFHEQVQAGEWGGAIIPVIATLLVVGLFPAISAMENPGELLKGCGILLILVPGTYPLSCLAIYLAGKILRSSARYGAIFSTWGYSYIPIGLYWALMLVTHILMPPSTPIFAAGVIGFVILSLMIALFLWKILFYFIELRVVLRLNFWQMVLASMVIGGLFALYYVLVGTIFGLKIPIV